MSYTQARLEQYNYEMDYRTQAARKDKPKPTEDGREMTVYLGENEEGEEEYATLPCKFEVCRTCNGKGSHVNPSIDAGGLTQEDFYEQGDDFREEYFGGVYDVTCYECSGLRVTPEVNWGLIQNDEKLKEQYNRWQKRLADDAEYESICAMERRRGA